MKKQLLKNTLVAIAALFIAIIALPTTAQAQDYVDLGLPSGTKWATCNLGASKPSDYGDYYAWGETEPKTEYTWTNYKWMQTGQHNWKHITKYTFADGKTEGIWYDSDGTFIGDGKTTLEAADDAATQKLGSPWRMPTFDEIKELVDNCTWTWTTQDGKNGYEVKSKKNGNTIFLPAAGCRVSSGLDDAGSWCEYWSGSLYTANSVNARYLGFAPDGRDWDHFRYIGFTVRPVYADTQAPSAPSITSMTSTTNSITVNWSKSTDNMTPQSELRYRVWCGLAGGNVYSAGDIVTNQTSYTVTGLDPDTEYELFVMVFNNADNDARSAKKTIRTKKAVTAYDLSIAGVQVTSDNCNDLTVIDGVTGTVKYNPTTNTLTLDNAAINATAGKFGINGDIDGLTVQVKGTSSVTTQSTALVFYKSATLTGDGTLNATGSVACGIYAIKNDLTIDGLTVNAKGEYGIAGHDGSVERLTIKNATVTAEGTNGSIRDFKDITLDGCAITRPAGAAFDASLMGVALNGQLVKEKVVIEPTGSDLYDVVLESYNGKKVACIKAVREITGLGLKEAKELVESAPCIVTGNLSKSEAETARDKLIAAGGTAKIYPHGTWIPTAIEAVSADVPLKKQGIYNLQGVKMNTAFDRLPAGIYIVDGKKVVKK
jgi:ribosomal protein L7/L12